MGTQMKDFKPQGSGRGKLDGGGRGRGRERSFQGARVSEPNLAWDSVKLGRRQNKAGVATLGNHTLNHVAA